MTAARVRYPLLVIALAATWLGCPPAQNGGDAKAPAAGAGAAGDEDTNAFYAFGASLARYASGMKLEPSDIDAIQEGLRDALQGKSLRVDPRTYGKQVEKVVTARRAAAAAAEKEAAASYLAEAAAAPGAEKTATGMIYQSLSEGTGASPTATDRVKVHYKGTLRDGSEFDSSISRGQPAVFHLNRVVPCWTEGLQKMKTGGKARLVCPAELAYGERGVPGRIPPGAPLIFEVELLEIVTETAAAPGAPGAEPAPKEAPKAAAKPAKPAEKP
jgi:FKBP-type peptidyl-prolyl cis-trans isomerase FkpA